MLLQLMRDRTLVLLAPLQLDDNGCAHQTIQERFRVDGCEALEQHEVSADEMRRSSGKNT